jgi:hypothetical protein
MASSESNLPKFQPRASSEAQPTGGRFANLRSAAARVESGSIRPSPHPEVTQEDLNALDPRQSTAKPGSLREKLGAKPTSEATVRMSVEMPKQMHDQVTAISVRAGIPKAEVVRQILAEVLPDLI